MANTNSPQARRAQQSAGQNIPESVLFQMYYVYSAQFTNLNAGTTQTRQVQIQADSDFMIQNISASVYSLAGVMQNAASMAVSELIRVQFTDTGSGANLFDQAQPLANIAGTGALPYILPVAKILSANSQLGVQVTSDSALADLEVYLSFGGKKLYRAG